MIREAIYFAAMCILMAAAGAQESPGSRIPPDCRYFEAMSASR